uniref:Exonuclease domain-containing protein n=1 Tax=Glossina brevipalpis TaxID=37001 RepID=A0A1A9X254_9MUSC
MVGSTRTTLMTTYDTMERNGSKENHANTTKQHHKENHNVNNNNHQQHQNNNNNNNNNNQHQHNYHQQQQLQSLPEQEQQQQSLPLSLSPSQQQRQPLTPSSQLQTQQQQQRQRELQPPPGPKNNSSDSGISTETAPINNNIQNTNCGNNNKRKSRSSSKRQDNNHNRGKNHNNTNINNHNNNINKNNINAAITTTGATITAAPIAATTTSGINANLNRQKRNSTAFAVSDWLQEEVVYCYDTRLIASNVEDTLNQNDSLPNTINLVPSTSQSSVCSTLSAASSTSSIPSSVSSSVVSTPLHSVHSSPTASPTVTKRNTENLKKVARALTQHNLVPLKQFLKLNMNEQELIQELRRYIIDPSLLRVYGFPVESVHHEGCIEIYKCLPKHMAEEAVTKDNQRHHRHFYGRKKPSIINAHDGLIHTNTQQWSLSAPVDSGRGSGDSSPRSSDSESSEMAEDDIIEPIMAFYTPDGVFQIFSEYVNTVEKQCVRCQKMFQATHNGEYLTKDTCTYHWGKMGHAYNGKSYLNVYSCCHGEENSEGCSQHPLHVWNGTVVGINGPYNNYLHTKPKNKNSNQLTKVFALDCEMSYTGLGLEVTKVTVVGYDGTLVYEHFVQPQAEIVDYNTRFSGITAKDLTPHSDNEVKTFAQVQQDLLDLIDADTILIGHGLDNDLRVLRIVHKTIVDTSLVYGHSTGYPYRRSLKNLTKSFLKREIQCSDEGHSSYEDSRACLELMLWKVRKDLRHWSIFQ